jgi:hypothetical protein
MGNFIIGTVFGIVVSSIGFSGIAHVLDKAVAVTKVQAVEINK